MNKIIHINLGGYPFTIDQDAYDHLERYLGAIHNHFRQSEGYDEITSDIESRLAELFLESLGSRQIVMLREVKHAISIMGTPEEFGAEIPEESPVGAGAASDYKTGKRFFRDPDDEVIGGVSSGIAAYFGIADPLWVRLGFVAFSLLGFGFPVLLYIILWAIVPKAETAGDRLSMRGEPINISNIGKVIEEEIENISHKVEELGEELSGKKKVREKEIVPSETPLPKGFLF